MYNVLTLAPHNKALVRTQTHMPQRQISHCNIWSSMCCFRNSNGGHRRHCSVKRRTDWQSASLLNLSSWEGKTLLAKDQGVSLLDIKMIMPLQKINGILTIKITPSSQYPGQLLSETQRYCL